MQLDTPQSASSSRFRLLDVRMDGEQGLLHLGAHLSGVLTETSNRRDAARWIAKTVAGPRPEHAGGSVEVDGAVVSVWALPAELLPANAPTVIDLAVVYAQWQASWTRRRDDLAAAHASCRLEGYRIDAALERARDRLPLPGTPKVSVEARPVRPPVPAPAPKVQAPREPDPAVEAPAVDWATPPDATARTRSKLQALVAALDAVEPEPLPEGVLLADAWDAHAALLRARAAADEMPAEEAAADIEALEQRVNAARAAIEDSSRGVPDDVRVRIEQTHRVVVEAEATLFEAKRRQRSAALTRYEEAVADELVVLADAGFDSYASYLFEITGGHTHSDLRARFAAETELAAARTELDLARRVPAVPTRVELEEREVQIRARATELLGHAPGDDPASELRALRVEPEGRGERIAEIAEVLNHGGVPVTDDVVGCARAFLGEPQSSAPTPARKISPAAESVALAAAVSRAAFEAAEAWNEPPVPAARSAPRQPVVPPWTIDPARWREVADLEEQRAAQNRKLMALEVELGRLDRIGQAEVARLTGADLTRALEAVLAAYRAGDLLGGRLPLIVEGMLDGLTAEARDAALAVFARATDVQTVVVTDDPEVMQSLAREGGTLVRWPERIVNLVEEPELESAPTRRA